MLKKKSPITKNQGWKPIHQKYKANENTSKHNPKKKQTNDQQSQIKPYVKRHNPKKKEKRKKEKKNPMQRKLIITKWQPTITKI
jgi:hypothetical protein